MVLWMQPLQLKLSKKETKQIQTLPLLQVGNRNDTNVFPLPSLHLPATPSHSPIQKYFRLTRVFSLMPEPMRFLVSLCVFLLTAAGEQTADCEPYLAADGTVSSLSSPCEQWTIDCSGDVQIMWTYYQSTDYVFIYKMDNLAYPAFARMGNHGQDVTVLEGPLRVTFERNATEGGFEFDYKCLPSSNATCQDVDGANGTVRAAINTRNASAWDCRNLYCHGTLELFYSVSFIGEFAVWNLSQVLYATQGGGARLTGLISLNVSGDVRVTTLSYGKYTANGNWAFFSYGCNVPAPRNTFPFWAYNPALPPTQEVTCNNKAVLDGATGSVTHMNYDHSEAVCWQLACEDGVLITWTSFDTRTSDYVSMYEGRPNGEYSRVLRASGIHNGTDTFSGPLLVEFASQRSGDGLGFAFDYTCLPPKVKKTCTPVGANSAESGTVSVPVPAAGVERCWSVSCYGTFQVSLSALDFFGNFSIENTTHTVFHTYTGYMRSGLQNNLSMMTRGSLSMSISGRGCVDGRCGSAAFAWGCNAPPGQPSTSPNTSPSTAPSASPGTLSPTSTLSPATPTSSPAGAAAADDGDDDLSVGALIAICAASGVVVIASAVGVIVYMNKGMKRTAKPSFDITPDIAENQKELSLL